VPEDPDVSGAGDGPVGAELAEDFVFGRGLVIMGACPRVSQRQVLLGWDVMLCVVDCLGKCLSQEGDHVQRHVS